MTGPRVIRFGIIGAGLMGREFAVVAGRWPALTTLAARPEIVAVCDLNKELFPWYEKNFPSIGQYTTDYRELLENDGIEAIYCAVPHNLHRQIYTDIIRAGKHLMAEKPFGIDREANAEIMDVIRRHPRVFVRCCSEFPFFPGGLRLQQLIRENPWGRILEVNCGFLHSSDMNFNKPINWKRIARYNGEYGCMGDLGMHALHIPVRSGWKPYRLFASLSNVVETRPDGRGGRTPCDTWDNATLLCETRHPREGYSFPMTIKTQRMAPGQTDTWYMEVLGTRYSARYSTRFPKTFEYMSYEDGGPQEWRREDLGFDSVYKTITGAIFEFGFTDAILQMWAAFMDELAGNGPNAEFGCIRPGETTTQHEILSAALESARTGRAVDLHNG